MAEAQKQFDEFLDKYTADIAKQARAQLKKLRKRLPGATQLVYDNYNALVIGFGPSGRASEAIFSIAIYPNWVTLCFLKGARLPDPEGLLKGGGSTVRHMRLDSTGALDDPRVEALIAAALADAEPSIDSKAKGALIIKSISAKQRPRRPPNTG